MNHPDELSLDQQIDEIIDELDGTAKRLAIDVINGKQEVKEFSLKQKNVWDRFVEPSLRRAQNRRDADFCKYLMDKDT